MKVSAVIPAYNEEKTVANVVRVLKQVQLVDEIIVINDGSHDNTEQEAKACGARVVSLGSNMGKGAAVKYGVGISSGDIILLLDADLIGLNANHVIKLLEPVITGTADMTIGLFCKGRLRTDLAHKISPYLSGQRAMVRHILDNISSIEASGYGIEIALTRYIEKNDVKTRVVKLEEITHLMKEEKLGLIRGIGERLKMYWHIVKGLRLSKERL